MDLGDYWGYGLKMQGWFLRIVIVAPFSTKVILFLYMHVFFEVTGNKRRGKRIEYGTLLNL